MRLKLLIGFLIFLLVGGLAVGAFAAYNFFFSPKHDDAIELVPEDSWAYFSVFLNPSTQQKMAIEDLLARTPLESFDRAAERLKELFDEGIQVSGCTFEEDFEPWIGDQFAGFALPPEGAASDVDGAALIATKDEDAARDAYYSCGETDAEVEEEKTYKDVSYEITSLGDALALIDGFAILGTEDGVKAAIDARDGKTLEDSERYQDAFENLTEDRVAAAYVDPEPVLGVLKQSLDPAGQDAQDFEAFQELFGGFTNAPVTATLSVHSDAVVFESSYGIPDEGFLRDATIAAGSSRVVEELPGDSWGVFGIGNLGQYIQGALDTLGATGDPSLDQETLERQIRAETGLDLQNDILEWIGDVGLFVRGTSVFAIDGGMVIESEDDEAAARAVALLAQYVAEQGVPVARYDTEGATGFSVGIPTIPQQVIVAAGNQRAVIAYGEDAVRQALSAEAPLSDDGEFTAAAERVGDDFGLSLYVELAPIVSLIEGAGAASDPTYNEDVKPFLESVKYVAVGTRVIDEKAISRLVVGVE